jgi:hypothetical protein
VRIPCSLGVISPADLWVRVEGPESEEGSVVGEEPEGNGRGRWNRDNTLMNDLTFPAFVDCSVGRSLEKLSYAMTLTLRSARARCHCPGRDRTART